MSEGTVRLLHKGYVLVELAIMGDNPAGEPANDQNDVLL